jgi:hypothetical protein
MVSSFGGGSVAKRRSRQVPGDRGVEVAACIRYPAPTRIRQCRILKSRGRAKILRGGGDDGREALLLPNFGLFWDEDSPNNRQSLVHRPNSAACRLHAQSSRTSIYAQARNDAFTSELHLRITPPVSSQVSRIRHTIVAPETKPKQMTPARAVGGLGVRGRTQGRRSIRGV